MPISDSLAALATTAHRSKGASARVRVHRASQLYLLQQLFLSLDALSPSVAPLALDIEHSYKSRPAGSGLKTNSLSRQTAGLVEVSGSQIYS